MTRSARSDERRIDSVVSKNLRQYRIAAGLSQTQLGVKLRVTFQQIQKYENGSNSLSSGRMRMLCNALKITPNDLFGLDPNGEPVSNDHPILSPWAYRLAFRADGLNGKVRGAVGQLVEGLVEHQALDGQ